jgi:stearoyl-CoA desaturase (delta-9 desaturase)
LGNLEPNKESALQSIHSVPTSAPLAEPNLPEPKPERLSLAVWVLNFLAVVVPFLGLAAAVFLLWGWGFRWVELGLLIGMYVLTALGITVGFHRLFTHKSFETNGVVQCVFAILGSMAVQGSLLQWVAQHRRHHQHSDDDPHSPHTKGKGFLGLVRGLWHAHLGWVFTGDTPDLARYVKDLRQSRLLRAVSFLFPLWVVVGLLLPTALGGLLTWSWTGALLGLLWGGLARVFLVHHVTWSVNSVCHLWGGRPYRTGDHSRNNFVVGVISMGEGWHNNHHAFPTSARHGLRWWQVDISYWVIRGLALFGLAWKVRTPAQV